MPAPLIGAAVPFPLKSAGADTRVAPWVWTRRGGRAQDRVLMFESQGASVRRAGLCVEFDSNAGRSFKGKMEPARFFKDEAEREGFRRTLKRRRCPHCAQTGFLICHGYLRGYGLEAMPAVRGYRFFCSNRWRKRGCGRTFTVLLAHVLPRRHTPAPRLFSFLLLMLSCAGVRQAWTRMRAGPSLSTLYRLWRAVAGQTMEIRRRLTQLVPPPDGDAMADNTRWTIRHIQRAFAGLHCPVSSYQHRFQRPLVV